MQPNSVQITQLFLPGTNERVVTDVCCCLGFRLVLLLV